MIRPRDQQGLPPSQMAEENSLRSLISQILLSFLCIMKKRDWKHHPSLPN